MKVETGLFKIKGDVHITPSCLDFISKCLRYDPRRRIDWAALDRHPFYSDTNYTKGSQFMSISLDMDESLSKFRRDPESHLSGVAEIDPHLSIQNYVDDIRVNCKNSFVLEIKNKVY